jgi:hypothetical protein
MRPGTAPVGARKKVNRNQPFGEVFQIKSINTTTLTQKPTQPTNHNCHNY